MLSKYWIFRFYESASIEYFESRDDDLETEIPPKKLLSVQNLQWREESKEYIPVINDDDSIGKENEYSHIYFYSLLL